ncbi:MAG: radical SAM protein [Saprospiraceae bacterium]|nr:radical SAM protein [Saprospiraceae bacterium]
MKFTIFVTQQCNLRCTYCYIDKKPETMSLDVAHKVVEFIYKKSILTNEEVNIGFFGGEPLLRFNLVKKITQFIKNHPLYCPDRVNITIVSNGTIFTDEIATFINENEIGFGISCDGPPSVQDLYRVTLSGNGSSEIVEKNIKRAKKSLSRIMVNAVYTPETLYKLAVTVEYLTSIGVRHIYLNPDFSAKWRLEHVKMLPEIYEEIGSLYMKYYLEERPHFISLIDSKIAVILREGYGKLERCRMGQAEFAFTTQGDIYPCERLVGDGKNDHCIGNVFDGLTQQVSLCHKAEGAEMNAECTHCGIKDYCMNWCGCSNYMSSGSYNRVGPFLCASEIASINTAYMVFEKLERQLGPTFYEHINGAMLNKSLT